jgi:hypothetical protein
MESTSQPKPIRSTPNHLHFLSFKPEAFAGLADTDLLFFFDKEQPIVGFTGDQGTGKTSALRCLQFLMGGEEPDNAINSKTGKKTAELVLEPEPGVKIISRCTRTGFTVTRVDGEGSSASSSTVKKPKDFLRKLIGPVGVSPMFLKEKDGAAQIKWARSLSPISSEEAQREGLLVTQKTAAFKARTDAGRDLRNLSARLTGSGWFVPMKGGRVIPTPAFTEKVEEVAGVNMRVQLDEANKRVELAEAAARKDLETENEIGRLAQVSELAEKEIKRLERELEEQRRVWIESGKQKKKLEDERKPTEEVAAELEAAKKEVAELAGKGLEKERITQWQKFLEEYLEAESEWTKQHQAYNDAVREHKKLVTDNVPKIEGLEACVPYELDLEVERARLVSLHEDESSEDIENRLQESIAAARREGLFYRGHSIAELSESELWDLAIQFWSVMDAHVILVENLPSLGSDAIDRINQFVEAGGQVFYSAMQRGTRELKVTVHQNL